MTTLKADQKEKKRSKDVKNLLERKSNEDVYDKRKKKKLVYRKNRGKITRITSN